MKIPRIFHCGIATATLLAMLTMASAQNIQTTSSASTLAELLPPPPPPPAPNTVSIRGTTTARGATRGTALRTTNPRGPLTASTTWTSEQAMNDAFVIQFNNTGNFGGGRMPAPTMRIDPGMRLLLTSQMQVDGPAKTVTAAYRIYSLELIGIAMHDTPVAFVVVRHKDNTSSLNNRELTDFEESAVKQLQAGKQIVYQLDKTDRLMVGAVRAEESCIQCHDGAKVGDLLGAFSYHLSLVDKPATPTVTKSAGVATMP